MTIAFVSQPDHSVLCFATADYVFFLSPNLMAATDADLALRTAGFLKDDIKVNSVLFAVSNLVPCYAPVYGALLVPSGRSKNKVGSNSRICPDFVPAYW